VFVALIKARRKQACWDGVFIRRSRYAILIKKKKKLLKHFFF